ncbi:hypothetical protein [Adhaeribacter aquaticus]|uniref:hypothetical protein n=1 Tax=Adhaeribacter aquaticus TaxID=299567 RepID=UPI0012FBD8C3|nr:hypothetical protein [Adhaeribacter aquaticus]
MPFLSKAQAVSEVSGAELNTTPPAIATPLPADKPTEEPIKRTNNLKQPAKLHYGLSMGSQFSRFGSAFYMQPSVMFPVNKRFQAFTSLNIITAYGTNHNGFYGEASNGGAPIRNQHYIVNVGGNYLVNDRLNITGSIWRDLSKMPMQNNTVNLFSPMGSSGMQFRAHYKVTENFSISGGIRYSDGNGYNNLYYPGFNSPFGF